MHAEVSPAGQGSAPTAHARGFLGHPRGLATLFFTELWERFSFYGMRALLILYMTSAIDKGGLGFDVKKAGAVYAMYTALVYLTAVPGGLIADRFIGQRRAVVVGGVIIASGHVSMAIPGIVTFFLGLLLIVMGTGLLKPNISTMVGGLYGADDHRRDGGFSIFYMGINLGALLAPLACGYLAQDAGFQAWLSSAGFNPTHAWHWGFGAAAVGMVAGLVQFLHGTKYLGDVGRDPTPLEDPAAQTSLKNKLMLGAAGALGVIALLAGLGATGAVPITIEQVSWGVGMLMIAMPALYFATTLRSPLWTTEERGRIGVVAILFLFSALFWSAFEQAGSSFSLFADRLTRTEIFGWAFPSSWFQSVNSFFIIGLAPLFSWLWVKLGDKEPSSPAKFVFGLLFVGLGFAVIAGASALSGPEGAKVGPQWLITVFLLHTIGELCLSPVGLSMVTKLAPRQAVGQLMGVWFMSISLGNYMGGQIAGFFESMPLPQLFGAICGTTLLATVILVALVPKIRSLMGGVH